VEQLGTSSRTLLIAAHRLTADLQQPKPWVYWADLMGSATLGYLSFGLCAFAELPLSARAIFGLVAAFALYRAVLFIHELTHLRSNAIPGFWTAWNVVVGIPLLLPSFFYEGVHSLHHAKTSYGTLKDPEYLPFARRSRHVLIYFLLVAPFFPIALLLRFALLVPPAAIFSKVRHFMVERTSSLAINPAFRRDMPSACQVKTWILLEMSASLWAWTVIALTAFGTIPSYAFVDGILVGASISLLNQVRTIVAHRWESEGEPHDPLGQLLDTTNMPPPALLPGLWAPVGLRYHALHHILPSIPYHNLGIAHRRMLSSLPDSSPYRLASAKGIREALARLIKYSPLEQQSLAASGIPGCSPAAEHPEARVVEPPASPQ
jgi:fatty acid desaturase